MNNLEKLESRAKKVIDEDTLWGEIDLLTIDDSFTSEQKQFAVNANIDDLVFNLKQVIFDYIIRENCLNHVFAHQAINRLKEASYWAKELINNKDKI